MNIITNKSMKENLKEGTNVTIIPTNSSKKTITGRVTFKGKSNDYVIIRSKDLLTYTNCK